MLTFVLTPQTRGQSQVEREWALLGVVQRQRDPRIAFAQDGTSPAQQTVPAEIEALISATDVGAGTGAAEASEDAFSTLAQELFLA